MAKVISLNFASAIASFTPKDSSIAPIVLKADVFYTEDEMLSKPQPTKPRASYYAANDGEAGQYIDMFSTAGTREITLIDSEEMEKLEAWAMANPQPLFDLAFFYKRNDQRAEEARTQMHWDCKFLDHPMRVLSNSIVSVTFSFNYAKIRTLDANGRPIAL